VLGPFVLFLLLVLAVGVVPAVMAERRYPRFSRASWAAVYASLGLLLILFALATIRSSSFLTQSTRSGRSRWITATAEPVAFWTTNAVLLVLGGLCIVAAVLSIRVALRLTRR
jgi:uncharacterized membrane protein YidH (DUF202 family)